MEKVNAKAVRQNPIIEPGEYLARLLSVEVYPQDEGRIDYAVEVEIDRYSPEINGTKLKAALYGTPNGKIYIDSFFSAFRTGVDSLPQAIGRYAVVRVKDALFREDRYSQVMFITQSKQARTHCEEAEKENVALAHVQETISRLGSPSSRVSGPTDLQDPHHT
jgi:hypothetical protein